MLIVARHAWVSRLALPVFTASGKDSTAMAAALVLLMCMGYKDHLLSSGCVLVCLRLTLWKFKKNDKLNFYLLNWHDIICQKTFLYFTSSFEKKKIFSLVTPDIFSCTVWYILWHGYALHKFTAIICLLHVEIIEYATVSAFILGKKISVSFYKKIKLFRIWIRV